MNRVAYNKNGGCKNRGINFRAENKQIRKKTNTEKRCTYFKVSYSILMSIVQISIYRYYSEGQRNTLN